MTPHMWRVAVAEASTPLRRLAVALVQSQPGMRVVAEVASAAELSEVLAHRRVDLVVMDAELPDADGIPFASSLVESHPGLTVVALLEDSEVEDWKRARKGGLIVAGDWPDLESRLAELAGVITAF